MAQQRYVDWDGLVYYDGKIKEYITHRDKQCLKMGGTILFSELPDPSFENLNYIYRIDEDFESTEDYFEVPHYKYKSGTWVQCADIEEGNYRYIIFNDDEIEGTITPGGDVDLSNYYTKEETIQLMRDMSTDIDADIDDLKQTSLELATALDRNTASIEVLTSELGSTQESVENLETDVEAVKTSVSNNAAETTNLKVKVQTLDQSLSTDYAKKSELFSKDYNDLINKPSIPSIEGLASTEYVDTAISNIPTTDLTNYYTKEETAETIDEAISNIDIPEVNLEPYATKIDLAEQVSTKADNVPFVTDSFVTIASGKFVKGDNLKGLSITTILTKLLGLQSSIDPDIPDEPSSIVDKIMKNEIPMFQIDEQSEVIEIPYNYQSLDETAYNSSPTFSGFYQKVDSTGAVIESGYQHMSDENDSMYYVIALYNELDFSKNVSIMFWDNGSKTWMPTTLEMSSDIAFISGAFSDAEIDMPVIDTNLYTLWIDSTLETCAGTNYRFIINENNQGD